MFAGIRFSLQSCQTRVEAAGSSIAHSTMSAPSRSRGSKVRSMCVTRFCEILKDTSSFSPERGHTTDTLASALRAWTIRPAATCLGGQRYISPIIHRRKEELYLSATDH